MKCIIFADSEPRFKWAVTLAKNIVNSYEIIVFYKNFNLDNCKNYIYGIYSFQNNLEIKKVILNNLDTNIYIIALGGGDITKCLILIKKFKQNHINTPKTITGFNGLVDCSDKYGLLTRLGSDVICINSLNDYNIFSKYLQKIKYNSNSLITTGYSRQFPMKINKKFILFVEQIGIPKTKLEKQDMVKKILELAKRYPDEKILIKTRKKYNENFSELQKIFNTYKLPNNIEITNKNIEELLKNTKMCVSFSSTVIIEAIILGIDCRIITDYGIKKQYHNDLFKNANIYSNILDILKYKKLNNNFKYLNCTAINKKTVEMLRKKILQNNTSNKIYLENFLKRKILCYLRKLKNIF